MEEEVSRGDKTTACKTTSMCGLNLFKIFDAIKERINLCFIINVL